MQYAARAQGPININNSDQRQLLSWTCHKQGVVGDITVNTVYAVRSDWDCLGERYTVLRNNRVVIITRSTKIIREWFPQMWMDTSGIPDVVLV